MIADEHWPDIMRGQIRRIVSGHDDPATSQDVWDRRDDMSVYRNPAPVAGQQPQPIENHHIREALQAANENLKALDISVNELEGRIESALIDCQSPEDEQTPEPVRCEIAREIASISKLIYSYSLRIARITKRLDI
jgi:hypothetical protein